MRKLFLTLSIFLIPAFLQAFDYGQKINSSQSDVATGSNLPVLASSAPIQFVGVTISSPAGAAVSGVNGLIVLYKSTSSTFTPDLSTWTKINCDYQTVNTNAVTLPLFDMEFTGPTSTQTFTYVQVIGNCSRTIWFRNIPPFPEPNSNGRYKNFGISQTGQR